MKSLNLVLVVTFIATNYQNTINSFTFISALSQNVQTSTKIENLTNNNTRGIYCAKFYGGIYKSEKGKGENCIKNAL